MLEKNVNLTIVKELGKILAENGANVQFRRTYDTYNPLDEIVKWQTIVAQISLFPFTVTLIQAHSLRERNVTRTILVQVKQHYQHPLLVPFRLN
ncbi:hypothetical protein D5E69_22610 (plasmid) [Rossellomorea marisflavi]|nr:hypothetical protein D5E69_22610 [Rossellomorea marisflavi]